MSQKKQYVEKAVAYRHNTGLGLYLNKFITTLLELPEGGGPYDVEVCLSIGTTPKEHTLELKFIERDD